MNMERRVVRIVNLTGHPLRLGTETSNLRFRSGGKVRLDTHYRVDERVVVESEDGSISVPILRITPGRDDEIPDPEDGVLYVVSGLVGGRVGRADVVSPAQVHKDENGRVKFARALLRYE